MSIIRSNTVDRFSDDELTSFANDIGLPSAQAGAVRAEIPHRRELRVRRELGGGVVLVGFDVPFWEIVGFIIKWAIEAIPALIVVSLLGVGLAAILGVFGLNVFTVF
ncbi:MAG: hypothetical protein ACREPM_19205 [Gemmatimonadaceae bacterium]